MRPTIRNLAMLSTEAHGEHGEWLDVHRQNGSTHECILQLQCATRCLRSAASRTARQQAGHAGARRGGHSVGVAVHPAERALPSSAQPTTARQGGQRRLGAPSGRPHMVARLRIARDTLSALATADGRLNVLQVPGQAAWVRQSTRPLGQPTSLSSHPFRKPSKHL